MIQRPNLKVMFFYTFFYCGLLAGLWEMYISTPSAYYIFSGYTILLELSGNVFLIYVTILARASRLAMFSQLIICGFLALLFTFSWIYWSYGRPGNFNVNLSHLDALYFTLGTLSTAGTGNIYAASEEMRAAQALQMGVDFGYTLLVVGILVSRLAAATGYRQAEHSNRNGPAA